MVHMLATLQAFVAERFEREDGATAVEYGLMVALIAVVIIGAVQALGLSLQGIFNEVAAAVGGAGT